MNGLETATLIVGLVAMGVFIVFLLVMMVAGIVLVRKATRTLGDIQEMLDMLSRLPYVGRRMFKAARRR